MKTGGRPTVLVGWIVILAGTFSVVVGLVITVMSPPKPTYEGKTAAQWFRELEREYPAPPSGILRGAIIVGGSSSGGMIARMPNGSIVTVPPTPKPSEIGPSFEGLKKLGPPAVEYLIRVLRRRDSWFSRRYASMFPRLPATLRNYLPAPVSCDEVRRHAVVALSGMGPLARPAAPALIEALRDGVALDETLDTLAMLRVAPAELDPLIETLAIAGEEKEIIRIASALSLRRPVVARALAGALRGPSQALRERAGRMLAEIGADAAPAVSALALELRHSDEQIRYASARALGEIGPAASAAAPDLRRALSDESGLVRSAAARALTNIVVVGAEPK